MHIISYTRGLHEYKGTELYELNYLEPVQRQYRIIRGITISYVGNKIQIRFKCSSYV